MKFEEWWENARQNVTWSNFDHAQQGYIAGMLESAEIAEKYVGRCERCDDEDINVGAVVAKAIRASAGKGE